jgi:ADP-ribose pyrophosphatase YjhB (NUDIX family)
MTMIAADIGPMRFQVRAAAVVLHGGRVLLQRADGEPFWTLPGGRSDAGEDAEATVRREFREETGAEAVVGPLLWIVENFFRFQARDYHEISWFFRARFADAGHPLLRTDEFEATEPGTRLLYAWRPVAGLRGIEVHPAFLSQALRDVPSAPVHVVQRDGRAWTRGAPPVPPGSPDG